MSTCVIFPSNLSKEAKKDTSNPLFQLAKKNEDLINSLYRITHIPTVQLKALYGIWLEENPDNEDKVPTPDVIIRMAQNKKAADNLKFNYSTTPEVNIEDSDIEHTVYVFTDNETGSGITKSAQKAANLFGSNGKMGTLQTSVQTSDKTVEEEVVEESPESEVNIDKNKTPVDISTFVNNSGGAVGSDSAWERIGKRYNVRTVDQTEEYKKLSDEEKLKLEPIYKKIVTALKRTFVKMDSKKGMLIRRDILQVDNSDEVFAVGNILNPNEKGSKGFVNNAGKQVVDGGTGYAVEYAIEQGKPVHVFNQSEDQWYIWNAKSNKFEKENTTPKLSKKFAGIGTRQLTAVGEQAIEDVYALASNSEPNRVAPVTKKIIKKVQVKGKTFHTYGLSMSVNTKAQQSKDYVPTDTEIQNNKNVALKRKSRNKFSSEREVFNREKLKENIKKLFERAQKSIDDKDGLIYKIDISTEANRKNISGYTGKQLGEIFLEAGKEFGGIPSNIQFSKTWKSEGILENSNTSLLSGPTSSERTFDLMFSPIERDESSSRLASEFQRYLEGFRLYEIKALRGKILGTKAVNAKAHYEKLLDDLNGDDWLKTLLSINNTIPNVIINQLREDLYKLADPNNKNSIIDTIYNELYQQTNKSGFTDQEKQDFQNRCRKEALSLYNNRVQNAKKIISNGENNFKLIVKDSIYKISLLTGISINPYSFGLNTVDVSEDEMSKDENRVEDGGTTDSAYIDDYRYQDPFNGISQRVRKALSRLAIVDKHGKSITTSIGYQEFLDPRYAHRILLELLHQAKNIDQMKQILIENLDKFSWINTILNELDNDPNFEQLFYSDMIKEFNPYSIELSKKDYETGVTNVITKNVNNITTNSYYMQSWENNVNFGRTLSGTDGYSLYDNKGNIKTDLSLLDEPLKDLQMFSSDISKTINKYNLATPGELEHMKSELAKKFDDPIVRDTINKYLRAFGIDVDFNDFADAILASKHIKDTYSTFMTKLFNLSESYKSYVKQNSSKDFIRFCFGRYMALAEILTDYTKETIIPYVRIDANKSMYSYTNQTYFNSQMDDLANTGRLEEGNYQNMLQDKYGKYSWFKNATENKYYLSWLEELANNPGNRDLLKRKSLIQHNKKSMREWSDNQTRLTQFVEFFADDFLDKSTATAWYQVPIFGESPSSEFIKFIRYKENSKIISHLTNIALQEIARINEARQECDMFLDKKGLDIKPTDNYNNITRTAIKDKSGKVKYSYSGGGADFRFFPQLNNYKESNGETFFEHQEKLSGEDRIDYITGVVNNIMEEEYENDYKQAYADGVFSEVNYGKTGIKVYRSFQFGKAKVLTNLKDGSIKQGKADSEYRAALKEQLNASLKYIINEFESKVIKNNTKHDDYQRIQETKKQIQQLINAIDNNTIIKDTDLKSAMNYISDTLTKIVNDSSNTIAFDFNKLSETGLTCGMLNKENKDYTVKLNYENYAKNEYKNFWLNSKLASFNIIELSVTDLAYFKDTNDFHKRYKSVHASIQKLNTDAVELDENGNKRLVGKKFERVIFIKEPKLPPLNIKDIKNYLYSKLNNGLSKSDIDNILYSFNNEKIADSQGYRTLDSLISIMKMMGKYTDSAARTIERIKNGTWTMEDYKLFLNYSKPHYYSQIEVDTGINNQKRKVPIEIKNSEAPMIFLYSAVLAQRFPKMFALQEYMSKHDIDLAQIKSGVKFGCSGEVDLDSEEMSNLDKALADKKITLKEYSKAVEDLLDEQIYLKSDDEESLFSNVENPNMVHTLSYEDYGIISSTPDHFVDRQQAVCTQFPKQVTCDQDLSDGSTITLPNGESMDTAKAMELWENLNVSDIESRALENAKLFSSPEQLIREVQSRLQKAGDRFSAEFISDLGKTFGNEDGFPLSEKVAGRAAQTILTSINRESVIKHKMNGGSLFQMSSYGIKEEEDLQIVYNKDDEGNITTLKYAEVLLPAWSKSIFDYCIDKNGNLDIERLNKDPRLSTLIGYRIPTEGKHSILPLKVKGFSNDLRSTGIVLPREIVTIAGSDFDIDKLYLIIPEVDTSEVKYNKGKALKDFVHNNDFVSQSTRDKVAKALNKKVEELKSGEILANIPDNGETVNAFNEWFFNNKYKYRNGGEVHRIEYDLNTDPSTWTQEQRNNLFFDLSYGFVTSPRATFQFIKTGSYKELSSESQLINILTNINIETIKDVLDIKKSADTIDKVLSRLIDVEMAGNTSKFQKLVNMANNMHYPGSPETYVHYHNLNAKGKSMIGIFSNYNANHAILVNYRGKEQYRVLPNGYFTLGGHYSDMIGATHKFTSLQDMDSPHGHAISHILQAFQAAAEDTAKDPILAAMNINDKTAGIASTLAVMGFSTNEICLFLNQPIIKTIIDNTIKYGAYSATNETRKQIREYASKVIETVELRDSNGHIKKDDKGRVIYVNRLRSNVNPSDPNTKIYKYLLESYNDVKEKYTNSAQYSMPNFNFLLAIIKNNPTNFDSINLTEKQMMKNIIAKNYFDNMQTNPNTSVNFSQSDCPEFYGSQIVAALSFLKVLEIANLYRQNVDNTHYDSVHGNNGGPYFTDIEIERFQLKEYNDKVGESFIVAGAPIIKQDIIDGKTDSKLSDIKRKILESDIPIQQSQYTLGIEYFVKLISNYVPYFNVNMENLLDDIKNHYSIDIGRKGLNNIMQEFVSYYLTNNDLFGVKETGLSKDDQKKGIIGNTLNSKRDYYINKFPSEAAKYIKTYLNTTEFMHSKFLQCIKKYDAGKNSEFSNPRLFVNAGELTNRQRDQMSKEWENMFDSDDQSVREFAKQLFIYAYFSTSLDYAPKSLSQFITQGIINKMPEYKQLYVDLQKTSTREILYDTMFKPFIMQYLANHANEYGVCPTYNLDNLNKEYDEDEGIYKVQQNPNSRKDTDNIKFFDELGNLNKVLKISPLNAWRITAKGVSDIGEPLPVYMFRVKYNNETKLYRLDHIEEDGNFVYTKTSRLGNGKITEYQCGEDIDNMKSSFHKVIKIEEFEDEFTEHQSSNEEPKELEEQNSAAFESLVQSEISIPKKFASMKNTINDNNYVLVFFHKTNAITNVNTKAYGVFTLSDFSKDPETGVLNGLDKLVNTKSYTIDKFIGLSSMDSVRETVKNNDGINLTPNEFVTEEDGYIAPYTNEEEIEYQKKSSEPANVTNKPIHKDDKDDAPDAHSSDNDEVSCKK